MTPPSPSIGNGLHGRMLVNWLVGLEMRNRESLCGYVWSIYMESCEKQSLTAAEQTLEEAEIEPVWKTGGREGQSERKESLLLRLS